MTPELFETILDLEPYLADKESFDAGDLFGMVNWELEQKDRIIKKLKTEIKEYKKCRKRCPQYQIEKHLSLTGDLRNLEFKDIDL